LLLIVAMWKTFLWNKYFTFFSRIIIGFINLQCLLTLRSLIQGEALIKGKTGIFVQI
jgi:hypothetical protein